MFQPEDDLAHILKQSLETGGSATWEAFITLAQPVVAAAVVRSLARWNCDRRQLADDLIQDTFLKLCANEFRALRNFRAGESKALCAYLRTIAASVVADHLNSRSAEKHGGGKAPVSLNGLEAGAVAADDGPVRAIERNLLIDRIVTCLSGQKERDRNIFWLYHRQGFTPQDISVFPGISVGKGGVETILYRLTKSISECLKKSSHFRAAAEGVLP